MPMSVSEEIRESAAGVLIRRAFQRFAQWSGLGFFDLLRRLPEERYG